MELRVGTSGYSYPAWRGSFYPADLPAGEMLRFYAERLPAVEVNNTFYRLPRARLLQTWAEQVPEEFRFVLKASRRITHFKRLVDAGDETAYLLETASVLGDRLGGLLFQLPPNLACDLPRLEAFLERLPPGTRAAFEFRHPSWQDEAVRELLRSRELALVAVDAEGSPPPELCATADWGYLRLRRPDYDPAALAAWARRLCETPWREAYVFFKHEDAGTGPRLAGSLLEAIPAPPARRRRA